jgi:hypothetical protein
MSLGIGHDFVSADKAVYQAKQQKGAHTPATIPSLLAHSLHRGFEGPVPLNADQLQLTPPPVEGVPAETGASAPVPPPRAS